MGANVIGDIPHNEGTPEDGVASLRIIFDLAEKYGVPIHVHCDEIDDEQSNRSVEVMAAFASKRQLDVPVTASHAVAMAYYNNSYMAKLTSKLIAAGSTSPSARTRTFSCRAGEWCRCPVGSLRSNQLVESGLTVALARDSIADPFYPTG